MQPATPQSQHEWLHKLVGEWTMESEYIMGPDQPPMKSTGTERVRSLGGLWTIGDGRSDHCTTIMTLGYDPRKERFVGSFVASIMTMQWLYEGTLDETGTILTLNTVGPDFHTQVMSEYQDIIEFVHDDQRVLRSRKKLPSGEWVQFMKATYTRTQATDR
jgi:Protein of unknown function (DUF1579)